MAPVAELPNTSCEPCYGLTRFQRRGGALGLANARLLEERAELRGGRKQPNERRRLPGVPRARQRAHHGFDRVAGALVRGCRALDNTRLFLRVTRAASKDIRLEGNDLARAQVPVRGGQERGRRYGLWFGGQNRDAVTPRVLVLFAAFCLCPAFFKA